MKFTTYQKVALTTVWATIFLIFVGGLVRASGAGLGCPDWPRCFGMWVPPTSASELPAHFDSSQFNFLKTWTEYVNRLIGAVIGLLILATFALSFKYRKKEPAVFYSSGAAFILVLIQGWLGGRVVISGLDEWLITLHMFLAMVIMMVLIYAVFKASTEQFAVDVTSKTKRWLLVSTVILLIVTFAQLVLGTQVREAIDVFKNMTSSPPREQWISQIGFVDEIHRSFSWIVFISGTAVLYFAKGWARSALITKLGIAIFVLIVLQALTGIGLYYLGLPPVYQVVHLLGVAILIALEFLLLLLLIYPKQKAV